MTTSPAKPPTQIAGVAGFNAFATPADAPVPASAHIDWSRLRGLPAFQMFTGGRDLPLTEALYADYCAWHAAQGRWPGEDPMGRLI